MSYPPFIFSLVHAKLYQRSDYILLNISPTPYPRYLRISRNRTFLENIEFSSELLFQNISISSSWKISLRILLCTDDYNFNKFLLSSLIYFKSWIKKNNLCTNVSFYFSSKFTCANDLFPLFILLHPLSPNIWNYVSSLLEKATVFEKYR